MSSVGNKPLAARDSMVARNHGSFTASLGQSEIYNLATEGQPNYPEKDSDSNGNDDNPFDSSGDDESDCKLPARRESQRLLQQHSQLSSNMPFDQSNIGEESGEEYEFPNVMDALSPSCRYPCHEKYFPNDEDDEVNVDNDDPSDDGSKIFYWNVPTEKDLTGRKAHLPPNLNQNLEDSLEDGETVALTNQNVIQPPLPDDCQHAQQPNQMHDTGEIIKLAVDAPIYQHPISHEQIASMELYELCENGGTPCCFYDDLIKLLHKNSQWKIDFTHLSSRQVFVDSLKEQYPTAEPVVYDVQLEMSFPEGDPLQMRRRLHDVVQVICYDFMEQLNDLLSDHEIFGNLDNLIINSKDHWAPYHLPAQKAYLDEVFDGKWYHDTIQLEVPSLPGLYTFWIPIIFYIDKTGTDAFQ